jgi:hypothetical protein
MSFIHTQVFSGIGEKLLNAKKLVKARLVFKTEEEWKNSFDWCCNNLGEAYQCLNRQGWFENDKFLSISTAKIKGSQYKRKISIQKTYIILIYSTGDYIKYISR